LEAYVLAHRWRQLERKAENEADEQERIAGRRGAAA
jgi:hypothetical protein